MHNFKREHLLRAAAFSSTCSMTAVQTIMLHTEKPTAPSSGYHLQNNLQEILLLGWSETGTLVRANGDYSSRTNSSLFSVAENQQFPVSPDFWKEIIPCLCHDNQWILSYGGKGSLEKAAVKQKKRVYHVGTVKENEDIRGVVAIHHGIQRNILQFLENKTNQENGGNEQENKENEEQPTNENDS